MTETQTQNIPFRHRTKWIFTILAVSLSVRAAIGYFVRMHLDDASWFPYGIYNLFDAHAKGILAGTIPAFWTTDASQVNALIYPPGYAIWLASIYAFAGGPSILAVQAVQIVLDSLSVLVVYAITERAFSPRAAIAAGIIAALSPLLAFYGATPLADAPASWLVLVGLLLSVVAIKRSTGGNALFFLAGAAVGASCWFRSNGLLLAFFLAVAFCACMRGSIGRRMVAAGAFVLGTVLLVAPIVIRNSVAFQVFVPTGLGVGTNLWEGIGETDRADEFGAVYGDEKLTENERRELGRSGDETVTLYWPDGVSRDRERAQKAFAVISAHPVWYAGVMAHRMWGLLKFAGEPLPYYGTAGINITPSKCLPASLQFFPISTLATATGYVQSVLRYLLLPLVVFGAMLCFRKHRGVTMLLLTVVFYYLVIGTSLHSEIRYSLPMQAVLTIFAGVAAAWLIDKGMAMMSLPRLKRSGASDRQTSSAPASEI